MRINDKAVFSQENVFGQGAANTAYAQYFIGNSYLNPLTEAGKCPVFLANVTFEPGCRNNWHIHHAKSGGRTDFDLHRRRGLVSGGGKARRQSAPRHSHHHSRRGQALARGKKDSWFAHIAIEVPGEETANEWLEAVDDAAYDGLE